MSTQISTNETLILSESCTLVSHVRISRGDRWKVPYSGGVARTLTVVSGYGLFQTGDERCDIELKPGHVIDMTRWSADRGWQVRGTSNAELVLSVSSVKYSAY